MDLADAYILGVAAFLDVLLMIHLRRRRNRRMLEYRMARSLGYAVRRTLEIRPAQPRKWWLRRAS